MADEAPMKRMEFDDVEETHVSARPEDLAILRSSRSCFRRDEVHRESFHLKGPHSPTELQEGGLSPGLRS